MGERISIAALRGAADAWETEITTPGNYSTEAFRALEELLLDGPGTLLALLDAVEAAHKFFGEPTGCWPLDEALARFDFGEPARDE